MGYQLGIGGSTLYDKAFVVKNALANKKRSCGTRRLDYVPKEINHDKVSIVNTIGRAYVIIV